MTKPTTTSPPRARPWAGLRRPDGTERVMPLAHEEFGRWTADDGASRPFGGRTSRDVVAEVLARRSGWAEIRPGHWAEAAAVVAALKVAGWPLGQRDRKEVAS